VQSHMAPHVTRAMDQDPKASTQGLRLAHMVPYNQVVWVFTEGLGLVPSPQSYGSTHMTRGLGERGCTQYVLKFGFLNYIIRVFCDFQPNFGGLFPFWGDLELDLRPDLGRKLG
jgi:hypothetical protein